MRLNFSACIYFLIMCVFGMVLEQLSMKSNGQIIEVVPIKKRCTKNLKTENKSALSYWMNFYSQKLPPLYG